MSVELTALSAHEVCKLQVLQKVRGGRYHRAEKNAKTMKSWQQEKTEIRINILIFILFFIMTTNKRDLLRIL